MLRAACVSVVLSAATAQGWVERTPPSGPGPRQNHAMCYDAAHGYVMMVGGSQNLGSTIDVFTWNGTTWTRRETASTPLANGYHNERVGLAYHAATQQVVMLVDTSCYTWNGSDWSVRGPVFAGSIAGVNSARVPLVMAHDPTRNQTVLYATSVSVQGNVSHAQTFVWDGFAWTARNPAVRPIGDAVGMVFDPAGNRLLLCTSFTGSAWFWEWTGANWQQRYCANAPSVPGAMTMDTVHGKIVMVDGVIDSSPHHTWVLQGNQWTQALPAVEPSRRGNSAMAFDPVLGRCVLFGGGYGVIGGSFPYWIDLGDTWELDLGAGPSYATFGAGCAGSRGVPTLAAGAGSLPYVGQPFPLHLTNLPLMSPVFLFVGLSNTTYGITPLPASLAVLGAPGCSLLASGEAVFLPTNVLGGALWQWTIPNAPGVSFYNQAFAFDPPANALGLTVSNGGHGTIGF